MTDPVISALLKRRAEIAAEAQALNQKMLKTIGDLAHLDATIQQFDPAHRPTPWSRGGVRGELTKTVLTILRVSRKPLSLREIAGQILVSKGIDGSDTKANTQMVERVRLVLGRQQKHGVVVPQADREGRQFWRIAD